ncbi:MAG: c-type cytochrome [Bryobacteraceae bacterium]
MFRRAARQSAVFQIGIFLLCSAAIAQPPQPQKAPSASPGHTARRAAPGINQGFQNYDPAAVVRGQKIFTATCSFCHGANATGGETGPDLLRSVVVLDDVNGNKIAPIVHGARVDKGMPKFDLSQTQIQDIATFLHQRIKDAALRGTYKILNIVDGNPKAGEAYFEGAGRCSTCHSVTGDLAHIGSKYDPVTIQQKIVMPRERRSPFVRSPGPVSDPVIATVMLPNGQSFTGKLDHIDDFNVALTDSNGDYHSFARRGGVPKVVLKDPLAFHKQMLTKYTDADIHNLTAYLVSLK